MLSWGFRLVAFAVRSYVHWIALCLTSKSFLSPLISARMYLHAWPAALYVSISRVKLVILTTSSHIQCRPPASMFGLTTWVERGWETSDWFGPMEWPNHADSYIYTNSNYSWLRALFRRCRNSMDIILTVILSLLLWNKTVTKWP